MLEEDDFVLVIGSSGIDIKGRPHDHFELGVPNQGHIRNSIGGVARNIAENLARLEIPIVLLTAVGDDAEGERVIDACEALDIDCDSVLIVENARTGTYMALLKPDGELEVAISDFEIMSHITPAYLRENEDLFEDATMIVMDATLPMETIATVFALADQYDVPICADPTTPDLAPKLCDYISQLYLIVPNAAETTALCGLENPAKDRDSAIAAARHLVSLGAEIAVVTIGEEGLSYADSNGGGFIKAQKVHVIDSTGAGDALSAAIIFGLLNDIAVDDAMKLGVGAAALTLQTRETVPHALNPETLYDMLA